MFEIFAVREVLLSSCISVLLTGALNIRGFFFFFFGGGGGGGGVGGGGWWFGNFVGSKL